MDAGLLIARLIVGLGLAAHGTQKLFGWFGGHGLTGTGGFFESLGFRPGVLFALAAGLGELGGGLLTAAMCKDPFGRLVAVGFVAALFAQMVINTGMTIGILPITGMTLPFVSYGGSSMVTTWIMAGLILNIGLRRSKYMARQSFEFDTEVEE